MRLRLKESVEGFQAGLLLALVVCLISVIKAEQLPLKTYTIADGLAHDRINRIVQDSHGFLWFCTIEGLSRFDGYKFTNYGIDEGLSNRNVFDLLETRGGDYWIATAGGICRFNPRGKPANARGDTRSDTEPMFVTYLPESEKAHWMLDLYEDSAGVIWCATEGGLYQLEQVGEQWSFRFVDIGITVRDKYDESIIVYTVVEDDQGTLWLGSQSGLFRRWPNGRVERFIRDPISLVLKDRSGRLWAVGQGLYRIISQPDPERAMIDRAFTTKDGLPKEIITSIFQTSDGKLWVGTGGGLSQLVGDDRGGEKFRTFTTANGLSSDGIRALAEDRDGNLWAAGRGVMKISRSGFVAYTRTNGIKSSLIYSIFEDNQGHLCLFGNLGVGKKNLEWFDGKRFNSFVPKVEPGLRYWGWGSHQIAFQDHVGEWWIGTGEGLYRYPKVNIEQLVRTPPKAVYTVKNGLSANEVFHLFEDSRGDIWIGLATLGSTISRWERATGTIHNYPSGNGIPLGVPTAFYEDPEGNIWAGIYLWSGLYPNGLIKYTADRFTVFTLSEGLPPGTIHRIYCDKSGRMWLATSQSGLVRVDHSASERPQFVKYTTTQGLSSNDVRDIVEDQWGRLYLSTGRGVDRLDVETGRVRHYTAAEGLPDNEMYLAFRDRQDGLWFGSFQAGLARLVPEPDPPTQPPPVFISGLRIAGIAQRLSELGETEVVIAELGPSQNQVQIDFFGLSLAPGETLRYQYKLEGSGEDWSDLTELRTANYPALTPGSYRFLVRAVSAEGAVSATPAVVSFTLIPPVWQRGWFIALTAIVAGLLGYASYRYRVRRLIELERVRTRIATDLHDDIGSNLSLIAMVSEVARQQIDQDASPVTEQLSLVARVSRQSVDAMSDIVWAVNPKRDHLHDLVERMRRFASDTFAARDIDFRFAAPASKSEMKLGSEFRRQVYLVFKEAVNNMAKHSHCTEADIDLSISGGRFVLRLSDNGEGFDAQSANNGYGGNGLGSMRQRAASLGGTLDIDSRKGAGTTVILKTPLARR